MNLYSGKDCPHSQRARIVACEKDIVMEILWVDEADPPREVYELNPDNDLPVLVDRELVLHNSYVIMEYLDERFPHPPLMPIDPVTRAQARLMLYSIDNDWYSAMSDLLGGSSKKAQDSARKIIRDGLAAITPMFAREEFAIGGAFSLVDCALAPLIWRLPQLGIVLPKSAAPLLAYGERLFRRDGFKLSLSQVERETRAEALARG
ncbi:MAG: stringent starvation protein A [Gammaproteobacteria bacterium]|nr:MAG: stringent starvation protein A [Gammaproteobacteria bacterium]RLA15968.1 MAG: stringent starvation protein A [Gammaproteobacteria bacterium]